MVNNCEFYENPCSTSSKYYSGDQIKNEIAGSCGAYGRQERFVQGFGWEIIGKEATCVT
jgi:hypothetical protein